MENKNKKLYILIASLVAVIVLLTVVVGVLLVGKKTNEVISGDGAAVTNTAPGSSDESGTNADGADTANTTDTAGEKDIFANEVKNDTPDSSSKGEFPFVLDGFEYICPADYEISYSDDVGTFLYVSDAFQMKIGAREKSYQDYVAMGDEVTQKTKDAGGSVLQDVKEVKYNGRDYFYFMAELFGDKTLVAYTALPKDGMTVGGQIVIENDNLSDEDVLGIFDKVVSTATVTDKPNTTLDEMVERTVSTAPGAKKEETVLKQGNSQITVKVPEGFYSMYDNVTDTYASENFSTEGSAIMVECFYYPEDPYFGGAENYVKSCIEDLIGLSDDNKGAKLQTTKAYGRDVYYVVSKYRSEDSQMQRLYAAVDLGETGIYQIEAVVIDEDITLDFNAIETFFNIK